MAGLCRFYRTGLRDYERMTWYEHLAFRAVWEAVKRAATAPDDDD